MIRINISYKEMKALSAHKKLRFTTKGKSNQDVEITLSPHIMLVLVNEDEVLKKIASETPKRNMN